MRGKRVELWVKIDLSLLILYRIDKILYALFIRFAVIVVTFNVIVLNQKGAIQPNFFLIFVNLLYWLFFIYK